jgi:pimeloyl-ACP methyl ester carboxylesterase
MTTPLLLLPGIMNDGRVWMPVRGAFVPTDRRTVVARTDLHDHVTAIAAAAISLMPEGPFAVAGFSLGGYVSLEVCRQAPDRIAGLALVDTGARSDTPESSENRRKMIEALDSGNSTYAEVAGSFPPKLLHPAHAGDAALVGLLADMARAVGRDGFKRQQTAAMSRPDNRVVLRTVHAPALVLCGQEDHVTPPELSDEMAGLLPGEVERVAVATSGHMSTLEQPAAVTAALARWLQRVDAATASSGTR